MNFSQFLSENPEIPHVKQIKPQPKQAKQPQPPQELHQAQQPKAPQLLPPQKPPKKVGLSFSKKKTEVIKERVMTVNDEEFKKGDFIVITRMENSSLNVYKGYYGEIKEIIRGGETALVMLEAMTYPKPIRFPIGHFRRRTFHR